MIYNFKKLTVLLAIVIIATACKEHFEDEKYVNKYLNEHQYLFDGKNEFYILTLRDLKTTCATAKFGYNSDALLTKVRDSLKGKEIFILTDNQFVMLYCKFTHIGKNLHFISEETDSLDMYGFKMTPYLFQIESSKIKDWIKINTKEFQ